MLALSRVLIIFRAETANIVVLIVIIGILLAAVTLIVNERCCAERKARPCHFFIGQLSTIVVCKCGTLVVSEHTHYNFPSLISTEGANVVLYGVFLKFAAIFFVITLNFELVALSIICQEIELIVIIIVQALCHSCIGIAVVPT